MEIIPKEVSVQKLFGLMQDAIAPRPIAFASTVDNDGDQNLAPFSFFNTFGANPPIIIFSPSRRGRDNTTKDTLENIKRTMEVVINVVTYDMVEQANLASSDFPADVSEFEKAGFTPVPSDLIQPYRVKESPVQFECKVLYTYESARMGSAGNLIVCEVLKIHIDDRVLTEDGIIDPEKIDLVGRMGRSYYCRTKDAMFKIQKPTSISGIGIDQLPDHIKNSKVLTGNDLGKLGMVKELPGETEIIKIKDLPEVKSIFDYLSQDPDKQREELHLLAQKMLMENKFPEAICVLMIEKL